MNELFESLDIDEKMKVQLSESFEKAVLTKSVELMDEHVETKIEEAREVLEEEYQEKIENLEDTLDGYMSSVVEEFIAENAPSYEAQIEDEKSKKLLEMFDTMLVVAGVTMSDISEARSERDIKEDDSSVENKLARSEKRLSEKTDEVIAAKTEANKYLKAGIIAETKVGLTLIEGEKFERLAEMVTFERSEKYTDALDTIKESIVEYRSDDFVFESTAELPEGAFKSEKVDVKSAMDFSKYV